MNAYPIHNVSTPGPVARGRIDGYETVMSALVDSRAVPDIVERAYTDVRMRLLGSAEMPAVHALRAAPFGTPSHEDLTLG